MKNGDLQFDFLVDKENHTLTVRREFAAPRQLVWDCYTQSALLDQWFAPKPLSTKTQSMDFREGGHWHYAMVEPNGTEYWGYTEFLSIHPIEHYTTRDAFSDASGKLDSDLPMALWDVRFIDQSDHSQVHTVVSYASLQDLEKVIEMGMEAGLGSTLERLDELLLQLQ